MTSPRLGRSPILSIVLAGGEGKRLMPLTGERAKPAVPFGAKYRLIDFAVSNLVNGGFRHIVVLTQYKSHSLDVHISLTWQLSTLLGNYVTTVPAQMRSGRSWFSGSADALYQNFNLVEDERPEHIIVFGADHIYRLDPRQMLDFHREQGAGVTVAGIRLPASEAFQFGVIEKGADSSQIIGFHEKDPDAPRLPDNPDQVLASMGNYIFSADVFREVMTADAADESSKHDVGGDIIPKLVSQGVAHVYDYTTNEVPGETGASHYWRDVGTLDSYFEAHMDLVAPWPKFNLYNDQWPIYTRGMTEPPAKVANSAKGVKSEVSNCILSSGVIVSGSKVSESVLSGGVRVTDAEVDQSVLMSGVQVEAGARIKRCIIDKNVVVPPGFEIGYDPVADARRFTISPEGVVAIGKGTVITPD